MIGVDSNILVRFFIGDDKKQAERARSFLSERTPEDPAFISPLVVAEVTWVLRAFYEVPQHSIVEMLGVLLDSENIEVEREDLIREAIEVADAHNAQIADCIIAALAQDAGCNVTMTFDKPAAKRVPGMELLA